MLVALMITGWMLFFKAIVLLYLKLETKYFFLFLSTKPYQNILKLFSKNPVGFQNFNLARAIILELKC